MEHTIVKKLENIKSVCGNELIERVINDALDRDDKDYMQSWLEDVRQYGCQSGCVSGLIYYNDTEKFFDEYQEQIQDAFFEFSKQCGQQPIIKEGNIKNWFAWFGYEWAVGEVLSSLENYDPSEYNEEEEASEEQE
ncbi:hypothetical protein BSK59_15650 [Paenibacillus odorifer]|uniref:DUF7222 domain-containing protein n=1 Tax=Paenibacillus odorifer TaxID=189426 RepID=UPI00096F6DA6|nr:hypothetical protein [Paenibacillus odorifer]OME54014.1 hypothetical protein BSK59_15650 [Paenibacillus odorifer]